MKEKVTYITLDGKEFSTKEEAIKYEKTFEHSLKNIQNLKKEDKQYLMQLVYIILLKVKIEIELNNISSQIYDAHLPYRTDRNLNEGYGLSVWGKRLNTLLAKYEITYEFYSDVEGRNTRDIINFTKNSISLHMFDVLDEEFYENIRDEVNI